MADYKTIGKIMTERNWTAWVNQHNLWCMGIEKDGGMAVLGMGRSVEQAFDMAMRSQEGGDDEPGRNEDPKIAGNS